MSGEVVHSRCALTLSSRLAYSFKEMHGTARFTLYHRRGKAVYKYQFLRVPDNARAVGRLCSHFGNCRARKRRTKPGRASAWRDAAQRRGDKTRNGAPPAVRPYRETTVPIERTESRFGRDGAAAPGNYDNYRNSWGAIRPAKRQKRTRVRYATRHVDFLPLPSSLFFLSCKN